MIESLVAVTILALAVGLTIHPVMAALDRVAEARTVSVAQNLAQGEIESIRALEYADVGIPGHTPSGVLTEERTVVVEGRTYVVETDVTYAGSLTGLDIIPQGGDGVEGTWDAGVDYKVVVVTVTAQGREQDPIVMETFIGPREIGAHEGIANARINLEPHEPFASGDFDLPFVQLHSPPEPAIRSTLRASSQVFPAIPPADYWIELVDGSGWIIHPGDVVTGLTMIEVRSGSLAEGVIRIYRPASMEVTVTDTETGAAVEGARLTLTLIETGIATVYDIGTDVVAGLIPDAYDIEVTASGYQTWTAASVNVPAGYPDPVHRLDVALSPLAPSTTTTTTPESTTTTTSPDGTTTTTLPSGSFESVRFTVEDSAGGRVHGATVTIDHPSRGTLTATTDDRGRAYIDLELGESFTVVASTSWGHSPDTRTFLVDDDEKVDLELGREPGSGLMRLRDGDRAEFLYRPVGTSTWTAMPANHWNDASFVDKNTNFDVAKRCLANGEVVGKKSVRIRPNQERSTNIRGWCP